MAGKPATDGRNYTIDLLRVIAAFFMACWHWIWLAVFPGEVNGGYWGAYFFNQQFGGLEGWNWFKGTYTMGFFVFVTGYFMMDGFKRMQAKGEFLDKRKHFMQTWRFTAKTYVAYAPLMLFGTALGWLLTNIRTGASFLDWIQSLWWNIWQFVGASGFGMFQNFQYSGADGGAIARYLTFYNGPLWYISAFIVGACIYYAVLIRNEKAAVFVVSPILFMASNIWLNQWLSPAGTEVEYGITMFLPLDVVRLWGPLCLGIWGWYLGNAIKKAVMSKTAEILLGISWIVVLGYVIITTWTGYLGGMMNQDVAWGYVAMIALVNRDPVTRGINRALQNFAPAKLFGDISAGLYVVHNPVLMTFSGVCMASFGLGKGGAAYLGIVVLFAVIFMICNKFILKPVYGKLGKVLHARDMVEVPAYYAAAETAGQSKN